MTNYINKNSPIPYYVQLKDLLKQRIERGVLRVGDQIPPEEELCNTFIVSRTVVRQALQVMTYEGLIVRIRGKGTFVAEPKISEGLVQKLTGFYQDMVEHGYIPITKVLNQKVIPASQKVASKLQIQPSTSVFEIVRLRFIQEEPIVLVTSYIPYALCPDLLNADLSNQSLYSYLEREYGIMIVRGRRTIEVEPANTYEARLLKVRKGVPLFVLESICFSSNGTPIEYFHAYHRGDRSRFEVELVRSLGRIPKLEPISESPDLPNGNGLIKELDENK
jgi:GntR family transcriptional regulator